MKYTCRVNKVEVNGSEIFLRLRLQERRISLTCRSFVTEALGHEEAFERALLGSTRSLDLVLQDATWSPADEAGLAGGEPRPFGLEQPEPGSHLTRLRGVVVESMGRYFRVDVRVDGGLPLDVFLRPNPTLLPPAPSVGLPVVVEGHLYAWPRDSALLAEALGRPDPVMGGTTEVATEVLVRPGRELTDGEVRELELLLSRAFTDGPHLVGRAPQAMQARETVLRAAHAANAAERAPLPPDFLAAAPSIRQQWGRRCLGFEPSTVHVMLRASGWIVSQATIIPRRMRFGPAAMVAVERPLPPGSTGDDLVVASVEDVATDPEARGLGFGRRVMVRLAEDARAAGFPLAILATGSPRFYAACGWRAWTGPDFYSAGERLEAQLSHDIMVLPLSTAGERVVNRWIDGPINLGDGPF